MLRAYIDDSGWGSAPMFVLAGWVSRVEFWEKFSDNWQVALDSIPRIRYFKMYEAHRLEGEFAGWAANARDDKLEQLLAVIKGHVILGVHCAVPHAAYESIISGRLARQLERSYVLAFYMVMIEMLGFLYLSKWNEPVDFVFDEQGKDGTYAVAAYDVFLRFAPPYLRHLIGGKPIHRSDSDVLPLQAADLLAWQTRRFYWLREEGKEYNNWVWRRLNDGLGIVPFEVTAERLQGMVQRTKVLNFLEGKVFPYEIRPPRKKEHR
jgi:hypothetical protein